MRHRRRKPEAVRSDDLASPDYDEQEVLLRAREDLREEGTGVDDADDRAVAHSLRADRAREREMDAARIERKERKRVGALRLPSAALPRGQHSRHVEIARYGDRRFTALRHANGGIQTGNVEHERRQLAALSILAAAGTPDSPARRNEAAVASTSR